MKEASKWLVLIAAIALLSTLWVSANPQGVDFYPLYLGSQALLNGDSPYSEATSKLISQSWQVAQQTKVAAVCAYPLPFLLLLAPLALLPIKVAAGIWFALLLSSLLACLYLAKQKVSLGLSLFLFYPLLHALLIGNSAVLWLALAIFTLFCGPRSSPVLRAMVAGLLLLKPQSGIFFALYLLFGLEHRRETLKWFALLGGLFLGLSLLIAPTWIADWLSILSQYQNTAAVTDFWPGRVLVFIAALFQPVLSIAASLQFAAFTPNDIYSSLPLLLVWLRLGTGPTIAAGIFSLIGLAFYQQPNSAEYLLIFICLPVALAGIALSRAPKLKLAACSTLIALSLAEGFFRWILPPAEFLVLETSVAQGSPFNGIYVATDRGLRLQKNLSVTIKNHSVSGLDVNLRTNHLGLRHTEFGSESNPKILVLGDSITLSDYLPESDTYVGKLGKVTGAEVINAGIGSVGIANYRRLLEDVGAEIKPDIIVVSLYLNDFSDSLAFPGVIPPDSLRFSALAWSVTGAINALQKYFYFQATEQSLKNKYAEWHLDLDQHFTEREPLADSNFNQNLLNNVHDYGGAWSQFAWEEIARELTEIPKTSRTLGSKLVLAIFPFKDQVTSPLLVDYPQRRARDLAQNLGIKFIDVLPALRSYSQAKPQDKLFFDHCHLTALGSKVVAETLAAGIYDQN